jgi:four helix bundle protein
MELTTSVYRLSEGFPPAERFGLAAQMRRSAVSIPANIAEGHERHSRGDYRHHVSIAGGSLAELETHVELAVRLGYLGVDAVTAPRLLMVEVGRMLSSLLRRLRT